MIPTQLFKKKCIYIFLRIYKTLDHIKRHGHNIISGFDCGVHMCSRFIAKEYQSRAKNHHKDVGEIRIGLVPKFIMVCVFGILTTNIYLDHTHAFVYGLKSADNTVDNISKIIDYYPQAEPQIVSMIRDGRSVRAKQEITKFALQYGTSKILHLTISPDVPSIGHVADGYFDQQYRDCFALIRRLGIKVIFRTMHEMNGGRFPRSGDPKQFIQAWRHVWRLSRRAGLDRSQILFDFSIVHHDMPSVQSIPSHTNDFISCTPTLKKKTKCLTMEDYYPGGLYVDLVGVTFYNRGKGRHHRKRLTPNEIIQDPLWSTRSRLQSLKKPIIVDEVATTAVNYPGPYDPVQSLNIYEQDSSNKNQRLGQLASWAKMQEDLVGLIYFNVDYTVGYQHDTIGESDRSVIDFRTSKVYIGIYDLAYASSPLLHSKLYHLFTK